MQKGQRGFVALLRDIDSAAGKADEDNTTISIADLQAHLGRRSFGPILAIAALPVTTPLVNIPGVASTMGIVILLTSVQLLMGRQSIWLPAWLQARSMRRSTIKKIVDYTRSPAKRIDKLIRFRLDFMTRPPAIHLVAFCCAVLGLIMPFVELIPGTSAIPAIPVVAFGLGIMTHDGALIILGFLALLLMGVGAAVLWSVFLY